MSVPVSEAAAGARIGPPRRILMVTAEMHPHAGGPPRVVVGCTLALAARGHGVEIAALAPRGAESADIHAAWPQLAEAGIPLHLFPVDPPASLGRSRALTAFAAKNAGRFDMLHAHGVWERALVASAAAFASAGKPYIISPHGMLDPWSMARSSWKKRTALHLLGGRRFLNRAHALAYGTRDEADAATTAALTSAAVVVPNGVDQSFLRPRDPGLRTELHFRLPATERWERVVLFYGRIHPKKGVDLLLEAFDRVAGDAPGAGLLIAGIPEDKTFEAAVRARASASPYAERILVTTELVGPQSRFVLDAADLFVLPSYQEGFSMAIVEAMARSLPVLITDACHLPEVETVGAGRVVPITVPALAEGLRDLLLRTAPALRATGAAGRELVAANYTWTKVAALLEREVYASGSTDDRQTSS